MPQQLILLYFIVPAWLLAGFADWVCHRRSHIESTSGVAESSLHLLLLAEMGIPLLGAIYLEVNALVLTALIAGVVAHEITTWIDLRVANRSREVGVVEQMVHSVLEATPMMVLLLLASAHWPQLLALFGAGTEEPRFTPEWSDQAPPTVYTVALAAAGTVLAVAPYVEELLRGVARLAAPSTGIGDRRG